MENQNLDFGEFFDYMSGDEYTTVTIGEQTWMAENFSRDGPGSCIYDDNLAMFGKYSRLYDYDAARNMCPRGWDLPSSKDFETLLRHIGRNSADKDIIKALLGQTEGGNDAFGFNALLGGCGLEDYDVCVGEGETAYFWVSDDDDDGNHQYLSIDENSIVLNSFTDVAYCSVRYIKLPDVFPEE